MPDREGASGESRPLRAVLGILLGLLARLWLATLRVRVLADEGLASIDDRPWIYAFWHGTQFPLLAHARRRPAVVLVSLSADGAMQARALGRLGLRIVRGSSSRGGVRGLAALVRTMRRESLDGAFAVDGPKGPYGVAKDGVLLAARATGAWLVPVGASASAAWVFRKAWDRYLLPRPFARIVLCLGRPLDPNADGARGALEDAIRAANTDAAAAMNVER